MPRQGATRGTLSRVAREVYKLEGMEEIQKNISRVLDAVSGEKVKDEYLKAANILRDEARDLAPVETGALRDAIFATKGDPAKPNALVGVNFKKAGYAAIVEFGSVKWSGKPFMRPAISATKGAVAASIIGGLQKVIEDAPK